MFLLSWWTMLQLGKLVGAAEGVLPMVYNYTSGGMKIEVGAKYNTLWLQGNTSLACELCGQAGEVEVVRPISAEDLKSVRLECELPFTHAAGVFPMVYAMYFTSDACRLPQVLREFMAYDAVLLHPLSPVQNKKGMGWSSVPVLPAFSFDFSYWEETRSWMREMERQGGQLPLYLEKKDVRCTSNARGDLTGTSSVRDDMGTYVSVSQRGISGGHQFFVNIDVNLIIGLIGSSVLLIHGVKILNRLLVKTL